MVDVVTTHNRHMYRDVVEQMHRDRKKIFVDQLKWDIPVVDGQYEMDQFDTDDAIYLMALDPAKRRHMGSVRLLNSTGPHLLGDVFPYLCEKGVPRGDDVWEITRLCTAPTREIDPRPVRSRIATSLCEFGLLYGINKYTCVAHIQWLSALLAVGWECEMLGEPRQVNNEVIGAMSITITTATLQMFRDFRKSRVPELQIDHIAQAA